MRAQPSSYQPLVEPLEERELLAGSLQAYVTGGNLYVLGSSGNDVIQVIQTNNNISVSGTQINVAGKNVSSISASSFSNLLIYGEGGNDSINLSTVTKNATIYGGTGSDTITCGTGNDIVQNGGGFDYVYHPENPSQPVINGISVTDIRQGQSPVCQTLAAMAEAIQEGHNFANDITYLGNDYYQVKLYGDLAAQKVYFNGWTTSNDPVVTNGEYWMVLMQRARLQAFGINPTQDYTQAQWDAFNQKTGGKLYSIGEALYNYTGAVSSFYSPGSVTAQTLQSALATGQYVVAQSFNVSGAVSSTGIIGNHAYAVLGVYQTNGVWYVRLYNPWGLDSVNGQTLDANPGAGAAANNGIITLTWNQFASSANFSDVFIAKPRGT